MLGLSSPSSYVSRYPLCYPYSSLGLPLTTPSCPRDFEQAATCRVFPASPHLNTSHSSCVTSTCLSGPHAYCVTTVLQLICVIHLYVRPPPSTDSLKAGIVSVPTQCPAPPCLRECVAIAIPALRLIVWEKEQMTQKQVPNLSRDKSNDETAQRIVREEQGHPLSQVTVRGLSKPSRGTGVSGEV